ncbi:hypothetical protein Btru_054128 [Bulinus truncatus]|nr:hypothetical protein Btru_054128 [Bulinus truncatus]
MVVVSHPHGCYKHVSFCKCHEDDNTYNESVCPGCSGAYVLTLKSEGQIESLNDELNIKSSSPTIEANTLTLKSEGQIESPNDELNIKSLSPERYIEEKNEIFIRKESESSNHDLTSVICANKLHHSKFIELNADLLLYLPACYQHNEITDLIFSLADLTVMVEVYCVDESNIIYQGTGKVDSVRFFKDESCKNFVTCTNTDSLCYCSKCSKSESSCQEGGEFTVLTSSALLVEKRRQSKSFKCTLFYDDEQKQKAKVIYGDRIEVNSDNTGIGKFVCKTCDIDLLTSLRLMIGKFAENWKRAFEKYFQTVKSNKERLLIFVFHPHSCKKYVSIGRWKRDNEHKRYNHDAASCPGSSGAYLLIPNFDAANESFSSAGQITL